MPDVLGSFAFTWPFYAAALLGYLLGSIPFGLVLAWMGGYGDIRKIGSGNIGATNVLRTGNKPLALATLLLDGGKGAIAVLIGARFGPDMAVLQAAASCWVTPSRSGSDSRAAKPWRRRSAPCWRFSWPVGLASALTWLLTAVLFRYSSLSGMAAISMAPVYAWLLTRFPVAGTYWADPQRTQLAVFIAVLVVLRHHQNIRRLLKGEEPKIGQKKPG